MDGYKEWAQSFSMELLGELLNSIEKNCTEGKCSLLLDRCGACHYKSMEQMLEKYVGDLLIEKYSKNNQTAKTM